MIYLKRQTAASDRQSIEIAAVEDPRSATQYEARGYQRCSFEAFREAWRQRDLHLLEQIRGASPDIAPHYGIYPTAS